jgi:hypothetical protein
MSSGPRQAAAALAFASIFAAAPAFASEPQEVVRALYSEPTLALDAAHAAGYFASDLAAALRVRTIAPAGFDYRYGAVDLQISGLELVTDIDHDQARVVAVFKNYGKANSVDWTLCRRPNGDWRITDAHSNTGATEWNLRQVLHMPAEVRC